MPSQCENKPRYSERNRGGVAARLRSMANCAYVVGNRLPPSLGIGPNGEVAGNINASFTVEPELSGNSDFLVRANRYQ